MTKRFWLGVDERVGDGGRLHAWTFHSFSLSVLWWVFLSRRTQLCPWKQFIFLNNCRGDWISAVREIFVFSYCYYFKNSPKVNHSWKFFTQADAGFLGSLAGSDSNLKLFFCPQTSSDFHSFGRIKLSATYANRIRIEWATLTVTVRARGGSQASAEAPAVWEV